MRHRTRDVSHTIKEGSYRGVETKDTPKTAVKDAGAPRSGRSSLTAGYSLHPLQRKLPAGQLPAAGIFPYA